MVNNQDPNINEVQMNLGDIDSEINQKKEDLVNELSSDETEILNKEDKQEFGEAIGDLFYKSVKTFFDIGFQLAKNLNLEFLTKEKEQEKPQKKV